MSSHNDVPTQEKPVSTVARRTTLPKTQPMRVIREVAPIQYVVRVGEAISRYPTPGVESDTLVRIQDQIETLQQGMERLMALVTAQSQATPTTSATREEHELDVRSQMLNAEGGTFSAREVARMLNVSRPTVYNWHKQGDIVGVSYQARKLQFPAWQFERDGLLPGLNQVLHILAEDGAWAQIGFMLNPNLRLNGDAPLDLLRRGDVDSVLAAARMYGEHASI